jgi:hypothetical protein
VPFVGYISSASFKQKSTIHIRVSLQNGRFCTIFTAPGSLLFTILGKVIRQAARGADLPKTNPPHVAILKDAAKTPLLEMRLFLNAAFRLRSPSSNWRSFKPSKRPRLNAKTSGVIVQNVHCAYSCGRRRDSETAAAAVLRV